ncbi:MULTISPECIES: hypothetical protein [unclassified Legionella]|uniref:hypothetical protein n=1 Tax=unclassified Legionella TaxID=2622702 RepID=UPI001054BF8D|nr:MULTISPECIES: hypothetical protein [unclassified Legionella]MDI9819032.1 hypothetical protein [Legionella sp. PL877]
MIKITRDEFLALALIPEIFNAKEISWFKSGNGNKLGIIIQINSNHKYDYLVYEKDSSDDYVLYPNEGESSSIDYENVYKRLAKEMLTAINEDRP